MRKILLAIALTCGVGIMNADGFMVATINNGEATGNLETTLSGYASSSDGFIFSHGYMLTADGGTSGMILIDTTNDLPEGRTEIFTLDGRYLMNTDGENIQAIGLEPGLYIARQGNKTFKFVKSGR